MATITMADTFSRNQYNLKDVAIKSKSWFNQQALLLSKQGITPTRLLRERSTDVTPRVMPGSLYMFQYDAKHKETLPYWDSFPLVFPYKKTKDGFIGLNMHYLPYNLRIQLLDRLMIFANNKQMNETTKLKYSWATINGVSKFKIAEPCIHQYLNSHVRTLFRKVEAQDWATAMMLPVERFVGSNKAAVWINSQR